MVKTKIMNRPFGFPNREEEGDSLPQEVAFPGEANIGVVHEISDLGVPHNSICQLEEQGQIIHTLHVDKRLVQDFRGEGK